MNSMSHTSYNYTACGDGSTPVNCAVNPCLTAECPAVETAQCEPDYCGNCSARWFLGIQEVTDQCSGNSTVLSLLSF